MDEKYKVGDRVCRSWRSGNPGTVIEVNKSEKLMEASYLVIYQVKFPECTGTFIEGDLVPALDA